MKKTEILRRVPKKVRLIVRKLHRRQLYILNSKLTPHNRTLVLLTHFWEKSIRFKILGRIYDPYFKMPLKTLICVRYDILPRMEIKEASLEDIPLYAGDHTKYLRDYLMNPPSLKGATNVKKNHNQARNVGIS